MAWQRLRTFSILAGVFLGLVLGVLVLGIAGVISLGASLPIVLACTGVSLSAVAAQNGAMKRLKEAQLARAETLAATGESVAGRVVRVYPKEIGDVATASMPPHPEPTRLALVDMLTAEPRQAYVLLPLRYRIATQSPVALVIDPADPDLVILDDRVSAEHLAGIAADPRWEGARIRSILAIQGIWPTAIATGASLAGVLLIGFGLAAL